MTDRFDVGASTIKKYMDIVYKVLCSCQKMFNTYIHISHGERLTKVTYRFEKLTCLGNVCGVIDENIF